MCKASFLTFLRVFLDSLYAFYSLLSEVALSLSFQPTLIENSLFSTDLNYDNFQFPPVDKASSSVDIVVLRVDQKLQNTKKHCSTTTPPQNEGYKLLAYAALHLLAYVKPSSIMPNRMPAVRFSKAWHLSMHSSLSSAGVSWHTLMAPSPRPSIT